MTISLYDATVKGFLRTLNAMQGVLALGLDHCKKNNVNPSELVEARIHPDMLPLSFQVLSLHMHSAGAIAGIKAGVCTPPTDVILSDYASLQNHVAKAIAELEKLKPADVNALQGKDVLFHVGEVKLPFIAEDFLFSFSVPNFYFHATTAYDLLRMKGVPLGKLHFLGQLPLKGF